MTEGKHCTEDDFLARLYGLEETNSHLEECPECAARWSALQLRRDAVLAPLELPAAWLSRQRAELFEKMEQKPSWSWRLAPAMAACAVVIAAISLMRPSPPPQPQLASNDSQFYMDIYSVVSREAPLAADPIEGLFEHRPVTGQAH